MASSTEEKTEPPPLLPDLEAMKQVIWKRLPVLHEIVQKHGEKSLYRYAQDFLDVNPSPRLDIRKPELIAVAEELIGKRLGKEVAHDVARQLAAVPMVSTGDHHSPIDNPCWINSNMIAVLPYMESKSRDFLKYMVVFAFSSVSLNNPDGFPRGIEFHGGVNGNGNHIRLPILPDKLKMGVVYGMRSFTAEDLMKAHHELARKERAGEVTPERSRHIQKILEEHFGTEEVLAALDLSTQITKINFGLWPKLFHNGSVGENVPRLVCLEIETLVTELLIRFHFTNPSSLIYRLFFDEEYKKRALQYFDRIGGAFSEQGNWGTYMFWALDSKHHRVRLSMDGEKLVSTERGYEFFMTPEGIAEALKEKKIFPSMFLCYLVVSLYYGMKCLGGFCQVNDTTNAKNAWGRLLREMGENDEAEALVPLQTKEINDGMALAYMKTSAGGLVLSTGIDMILEDTNTSLEKYRELSKHVTLYEMMQALLPVIYKVLHSFPQRDPAFAHINAEWVLRETGLQKKLQQYAA